MDLTLTRVLIIAIAIIETDFMILNIGLSNEKFDFSILASLIVAPFHFPFNQPSLFLIFAQIISVLVLRTSRL